MKKNADVMNARFTLKFIEKKIVGTKASFDKASKGFGPIYEELAAKMAAHPDYEIEIVAPKSNKERQVYPGMDISFMRDYIAAKEDTVFSEKFEKVLIFAGNSKKSKYPIAKKFFLKQYGPADDKTKDADTLYKARIAFFNEAKLLVEDYRVNKAS